MIKEEKILFPHIKYIEGEIEAGNSVPGYTGFVSGPIRVIESEHESAGRAMKMIRELSKDFLLPGDACPTFKLTYKMLEEFEKDTHQHIHLENNILFPKAIKLESRIIS